MYLKFMKKNRKMSPCNRLELEATWKYQDLDRLCSKVSLDTGMTSTVVTDEPVESEK